MSGAKTLQRIVDTLLEMAERARKSGDYDVAEQARGMARDILDYFCYLEQQS